MLLFGASTFACGLAPRRLAAALERPTRRLGIVCVAVLAATALGWLMLQTGMMAEGWADAFDLGRLWTVLSGTQFGWAWQLHGAAVLALAAGLGLRSRRLVWPLSGAVLASLGLVGHAAMLSGPAGWLHRANLALHLLGAGFWLGGLVPLLATLRLDHDRSGDRTAVEVNPMEPGVAGRSAPAFGRPALAGDPPPRAEASLALRRFSAFGHGAVTLTILTGVVNTMLILGARGIDLRSPYQRLLGAKVALVALMIGLALVNRYGLVPHLRGRPQADRALRRNSVAELGLGLGVIGLVSLLGLLEPG